MKIIEVVFDIPVNKKFEYNLKNDISPFVRVLAPFGKTRRKGFVVSVKNGSKEGLKEIIKVYDRSPIINSHLFEISYFISDTFISSIGQAVFSIIGNLPLKMPFLKIENPVPQKDNFKKEILVFKKEKNKKKYYLDLIKKLLNNGSVIFLVPEVEKGIEYFSFFKEHFPETVLYHGELSGRERGKIWAEVAIAKKILIVSTRIGIFLPLADLSGIIIEDVNNQAYLEKQTPKYNTLTVAEFRCQKLKIPLFAGTNCFSIKDYVAIKEGKYQFVEVDKEEHLPEVHILKIRRNLMDKNLTFLTRQAISIIEETIIKGEKVAIIHNRKGTGKLLICEKCNYRFSCKNCSTLLSLSDDKKKLFCKYCKSYFDFEKKCPQCGSRKIGFKIYGIEKIVDTLMKEYKNLKIVKYTGENKRIEDDFDIVVGTSVIEEILNRYKFGIVIFSNADFFLNINDYSAEEKFFILVYKFLSKLPGHSTLIIQTGSPELEIFKAIKENNPEIFYKKETKIRKQIKYPPFSKILKIEVKGSKQKPLKERKKLIEKTINENKLEIIYSGESFPPVVGKKQIWKFLVRLNNSKIPEKLKEIIDGNFITAEINPTHI